MTGKYLTDATVGYDQFRKPLVNFELTREGGRIFARLTGANINKPMAIVLDGRVARGRVAGGAEERQQLRIVD